MKTYGFKAQFAEALEDDTKLSTIRAISKHRPPPVPSEVIRRYTGMRTKKCAHRGDRICREVNLIKINSNSIAINGRTLPSFEAHLIARIDGFGGACSMITFFRETHRLPFRGHHICWHPKSTHPAPTDFSKNPKLRNV